MRQGFSWPGLKRENLMDTARAGNTPEVGPSHDQEIPCPIGRHCHLMAAGLMTCGDRRHWSTLKLASEMIILGSTRLAYHWLEKVDIPQTPGVVWGLPGYFFCMPTHGFYYLNQLVHLVDCLMVGSQQGSILQANLPRPHYETNQPTRDMAHAEDSSLVIRHTLHIYGKRIQFKAT
ncbi:uncharacterized protein BCR38DRAFT_409673 [Pseudomassariella vexata]|uniref:Uncharacterized protein n=1 Tax=Pseudomassariella vexata TaxID=1141098 RepID=A0A1Y2DYH6_9PEZI|nr:uncharacterized protein BCR38DRAFT_409673 [Pseudomassariella vexata]ORY64297.1 hypothetical protein BCR38DRAFT_409673 [Pseudomassariella vexata]